MLTARVVAGVDYVRVLTGASQSFAVYGSSFITASLPTGVVWHSYARSYSGATGRESALTDSPPPSAGRRSPCPQDGRWRVRKCSPAGTRAAPAI